MNGGEVVELRLSGIVYNYDEQTRAVAEKLTRAIYLKLGRYVADGMFDRECISSVMAARDDLWRGNYVVVVDFQDRRWRVGVRHEGEPRKV